MWANTPTSIAPNYPNISKPCNGDIMPDAAHTLGELLIAKGVIGADQLRIALQAQHQHPQSLGHVLVDLGFVSEATLREVLSEKLGQESVDLATVLVEPAALECVPKALARRYQLLPLALDNATRTLTLAIADPDNIIALDQVRALLGEGFGIVAQLASESDIVRAIDQHYGVALSIDGILHEIEPADSDEHLPATHVNEFSQPIVRLIDALLTEAVQRGASDIHFEPEQRFLRIRYRIDGVLHQVRSVHKSYWASMVVRLKVMSGMNIAETRAPQDGRISLRLSGRPIDFRVASHPTTHGENLVLRILDRQKGIVPLDALGLADDPLSLLKTLIAKPEGIILVTGPTGSGKTTTLYSVLTHINHESVNIMTLEDPVEYPLALVRQTSVNEAAKLDFANGIRSIMRQDPDIILVGEIRDHATAEMAFRAAMTGHQVYATLHSNSAIGAVPRLLDIGVLPDILAGNMIGIVAQRLVRKLCPHCKMAYTPDVEEREWLHLPADQVLYRAVGCEHCQQQGYRGRLALMEVLRMDHELDDLVARRARFQEIRLAALRKDFRPLAADGVRRIVQGITSLAEVARVVDLRDGLA
jgi:type II secretory ATPase GspE/PulE/Tfp pilus assembly ATPase PilB-like protein